MRKLFTDFWSPNPMAQGTLWERLLVPDLVGTDGGDLLRATEVSLFPQGPEAGEGLAGPGQQRDVVSGTCCNP